MTEGSRSEAGSGSVPLTNGSGFRRPKNIRIRILNTELRTSEQYTAQMRRRIVTVDHQVYSRETRAGFGMIKLRGG
jgi:hypothetical protein